MTESKRLKETLTLVLAGSQGERLYPLTRDRAKPAVPFSGRYRIWYLRVVCGSAGL